MSAPTDEELTQWLDRESHWPKGQRDIVRAVRREIDSLRAENAKLRTQLAHALAAPTNADRAEARRCRESLRALVKEAEERTGLVESAYGASVDAMAALEKAGAVIDALPPGTLAPGLLAAVHDALLVVESATQPIGDQTALAIARDVLEEAPREQPEQVPEAVRWWQAMSSEEMFQLMRDMARGMLSVDEGRKLDEALEWLRTARLGGQPSERERLALEVANACADWARDMGTCHLCSCAPPSESHDADCPVRAYMAAPPEPPP